MIDFRDDPIYQDIAADEAKRKRVEARRRRHPSCADPDHPGCMWCRFDEDGEEEEAE